VLADVEWVPEMEERHTRASGSVPVVSLNQACLQDAACLVVPEGVEMDGPVQVRCFQTKEGLPLALCSTH